MVVIPAPVHVLYGTELGNAEDISTMIATSLTEKGIQCVVHDSLEAVERGGSDLLKEIILIVVCSTTGEGDPPDNALSFFKILKNWTKAGTCLKFCRFAVLGLGDTNYDNFCQSGKRIDRSLSALGASRFHGLGLADDAVGLEEVVEPWMAAVVDKVVEMRAVAVATMTTGTDPVVEKEMKMPRLSQPYVTLRWHDHTATGDETAVKPPTESPDPSAPLSRSNPHKALVTLFKRLSADDSRVKETYALRMDISQRLELLDYKPGDSFGALCCNAPDEVDAILTRLNLDTKRHQGFTLGAKAGKELPKHMPATSTPAIFFKRVARLRGPLKKSMLRRLAEEADDAVEKRTLQLWSSKQGSALYDTHIMEEGMWLIDLLNKFPSCTPRLETLIEILPGLSPRYYSASSTPSQGGELEFAFSVSRFQRGSPYNGRIHSGLFTGMLERMYISGCEAKGGYIHIFPNPVKSHFHLPPDTSASIIMIGPGTGVAPFVGFIRELSHKRAQAKENGDDTSALGNARLYFGNRHEKLDFLYQEELSGHAKAGTVTLHTAWSRDKSETAAEQRGEEEEGRAGTDTGTGTGTGTGKASKGHIRYVQDALKRDASEIATLILNGAYVFVCGDAKHMAVNVNDTIVEILSKSDYKWGENTVASDGAASVPSPQDFVKQMKESHRFVLDVWA